jgi:protein involved in polysaccharide export with SLBB domain
MERPQIPPIVQTKGPEGSPLLPLPLTAGDEARIAAPPPAVKPREPLHAPRPLNGDKVASGYPELPPPVITHPLDAPREFEKRAVSAYIIEPPDVLAIEGSAAISDPKQPITGPHLVRPDGTVGLGSYGSVFVAGMTIEQAKEQIIRLIQTRQTLSAEKIREGLKVDVAAFNSKFYYVITDGGGYGEQVIRVPFTGNEMVLDAVAQIQGLPAVASKKQVWIARATPNDHNHPYILPVDWCGITQRGSAATNYQIYPGDRLYVNSDKRIRIDSWLGKTLAPIERLLGVTLLGSSVVNSIKNGSNTGSGGSAFR